MKKAALLLAACVLVFPFVFANAGGTDCYNLVGTWNFDMGGGRMAHVTYGADGKFVQKMPGIDLSGTYKQHGKTFKTEVNSKSTNFTIVSCTSKKLTVKRDKDGMTMLYTK